MRKIKIKIKKNHKTIPMSEHILKLIPKKKFRFWFWQ